MNQCRRPAATRAVATAISITAQAGTRLTMPSETSSLVAANDDGVNELERIDGRAGESGEPADAQAPAPLGGSEADNDQRRRDDESELAGEARPNDQSSIFDKAEDEESGDA